MHLLQIWYESFNFAWVYYNIVPFMQAKSSQSFDIIKSNMYGVLLAHSVVFTLTETEFMYCFNQHISYYFVHETFVGCMCHTLWVPTFYRLELFKTAAFHKFLHFRKAILFLIGCSNILNSWKSHFYQLLNARGVNDIS
jgi:hypothetical protein